MNVTELIERLRERGGDLHMTHGESGARDCNDAADALEAQAKKIAELHAELAAHQCEGPAHVCHNLATERAEVRRLRDWQRRVMRELVTAREWQRKACELLNDPFAERDEIKALIEEAGRE